MNEEGWERPTMRHLSADLGVMPNALYSHFADKESLIDTLLDRLLADIEVPDRSGGDCGGADWPS